MNLVLASWLILAALASPISRAEDAPPSNDAPAAAEPAQDDDAEDKSKQPAWDGALKSSYGLSDEKLAELRGKGLSAPQIARVAHFAKLSGKSVDEIAQMRTEQKLGWGQIAKQLGQEPGEAGKAVSELRKQVRDERKEARKERRQARQDRRQERRERRHERRQQRQERRKERRGDGNGA